MRITELIRQQANPDGLALIERERELSYGELFERSAQIATWLREALPSTPGRTQRIGVLYPSGLDYVLIAFSVLEAGFCFTPVPSEFGEVEQRELVTTASLDALLTLQGNPPTCLDQTGPSASYNDPPFTLHRLSSGPPAFPEDGFHQLNPAFIRFSSGTTGKSKGVVLSHESLLERITAANQGVGIREGDRILWVLPMAHHFAVSIVLYLYHGATTLIEESHLGQDLLKVGADRKATVMYGSPYHFQVLTHSEDQVAWPSLRLAVSTAAALDATLAREFFQRFGVALIQGFGIIEVGLPMLNLQAAREDPEAIGMPLPGFAATLSPMGDLPEGCGELLVKGPGCFDAYLVPWAKRSEVLDNKGWFHTGDLAKQTADGNFVLQGRLKTLINIGGMKVFAEEIERVLDAHPGVRRSLVEPLPHPTFGEVPIAKFIPNGDAPSPAELRAHCRSSLASFKVPLLLTTVDTLPTTANGKLRRQAPSPAWS